MGREDVKAVKLRITDLVDEGHYMCCRKLGEGGCGIIFEIFLLSNPEMHAACKAELGGRSQDDEILKLEAKVMKKLNEAGAKHAPKCIREGSERNYNYLIMSLLGPSIADLRKQTPDYKLTLFTSMAVTIQGLDAIKEIHDVGYLHRDIKPSNFTIGLMGTSRERLIYLVDFGLARKYVTTSAGVGGKQELRKKRKSVPFRGTVRYCSLNVHSQEEQGRHDDLWSLIYMFIEMYQGNLPWNNFDREKTELCKIESEQELLLSCPKELDLIVGHLKNLNYSATPNYEFIRALLCRVVTRQCVGANKLDWEHGGAMENCLRKRALLQKERGNEKACPSLLRILQLTRTPAPKLKDDSIPAVVPAEKPAVTHSSVDDTIEASGSSTVAPAAKKKKDEEVLTAKLRYKGASGR